MIAINLEEKNAIRERYPNVHIVRTMKNDSKRHHYFCTEDPGPMSLLRKLRGEKEPVCHNRKRRR